MHGLVGPFEHDFQMSMDVSPRDEVVFRLSREGPHELWMANTASTWADSRTLSATDPELLGPGKASHCLVERGTRPEPVLR